MTTFKIVNENNECVTYFIDPWVQSLELSAPWQYIFYDWNYIIFSDFKRLHFPAMTTDSCSPTFCWNLIFSCHYFLKNSISARTTSQKKNPQKVITWKKFHRTLRFYFVTKQIKVKCIIRIVFNYWEFKIKLRMYFKNPSTKCK